jgi:hypothetical protein
MSKDGKDTQYWETKREDTMDKGRHGEMMEVYTLGNTKMT